MQNKILTETANQNTKEFNKKLSARALGRIVKKMFERSFLSRFLIARSSPLFRLLFNQLNTSVYQISFVKGKVKREKNLPNSLLMDGIAADSLNASFSTVDLSWNLRVCLIDCCHHLKVKEIWLEHFRRHFIIYANIVS